MEAIISIFILPIMIINIFGGIVAGIWLVILGKFTLVLSAILILIISRWIISFVVAPGLLLTVPLLTVIEKKRYATGYILGALTNLWTCLVATIWCVSVFVFIISKCDTGPIWPYLLLGYSVAVGPWGSDGDPNATGSLMGVFCCLGGVTMMIVTIFSHNVSILKLAVSFGLVMVIAWIFYMIQIILLVNENR